VTLKAIKVTRDERVMNGVQTYRHRSEQPVRAKETAAQQKKLLKTPSPIARQWKGGITSVMSNHSDPKY
jgi:hypothetical protein